MLWVPARHHDYALFLFIQFESGLEMSISMNIKELAIQIRLTFLIEQFLDIFHSR